MIAVGDVALVRDALDDAEALLQGLGELVGGGLERRTVQRVVDVLGGLPLGALVVHALHDAECERRGLVISMTVARHVLDALVEAGIAKRDGGITTVEQLVDGFALLETRERTVLPQDGRGIRERALETVVTAAQGAMAQLEALLEDVPELLLVAAAGQRDIDQVDGHDALVEATVELGLRRIVVAGIGHVVIAIARTVRREEAATTHARVAVTLSFCLTGGKLVLLHLLLGDVVGHHALGRALGGELREVEVGRVLGDVVFLEHVDELGERRGDPDAFLVLDALVALAQRLLDDHGEVMLLLLVTGLVEVHEDGDEGSLAVGGHERDDLILDGLDAALDFLAQTTLDDLLDLVLVGLDAQHLELGIGLAANLLAGDVDEGREVRERDGLAAVLAARHLGDDLRGDVARGGEHVRTLDESARDDRAVLQHVLEIDEVAVVHVLGEVVGVVEVDDTAVVGLDDLARQEHAHGEILGDLARHVVALDGIDGRVLIGVLLLHFLVVALDKSEDLVIGRVALALEVLEVAIDDVLARNLELVERHDLVLDHVLDFLDRDRVAGRLAGILDVEGRVLDLARRETLVFGNFLVRRLDCVCDFREVKNRLGAISLDDLHASLMSLVFEYLYATFMRMQLRLLESE